MGRDEIIVLLSGSSLFEGASPELLGDLVDQGEVISMERGRDLIIQGKNTEAVWVLLSGSVVIFVDEEAQRKLDEAGTILGEISAVSHTPATATVQAATELSALRIPQQGFHKALSSSEELATSVLRSLAKYLG